MTSNQRLRIPVALAALAITFSFAFPSSASFLDKIFTSPPIAIRNDL